MSCPFCDSDHETLDNTGLLFMRYDKYPVTPGHMLIIPVRHTATYFGLFPGEVKALDVFLNQLKNNAEAEDPTIDGWNIGMNCGASAGQTVMHCHIHLIPRRTGDVGEPRGGVRGVIPGKQQY